MSWRPIGRPAGVKPQGTDIAGVLFFARGLYDASLDKRTGHVYRSHYQTRHLQGATIGIVGLGGIGREVARFARGFSMRVVATRASIFNPLSATPTALT